MEETIIASEEPVVKTKDELPKKMKAKMTRAERRALQESQRAAKAAVKGNGKNSVKQLRHKKDDASVASLSTAATDNRGADLPPDEERMKYFPPPHKQFDGLDREGKATKRSALRQTEVRNLVELFCHLPQYESGTLLPNMMNNHFQLDHIHPAVFEVGMMCLKGDISGSNARCTAMLHAFREAIKDYSTPPGETVVRDVLSKLNSYVSFLGKCRPLTISMGNAIQFLKNHIAKLPLDLSESDAKYTICLDIDWFINDKIVLADKMIVRHAVAKIRDGDVLLTYGLSCVVQMILFYAHDIGKQFRVIVVDSRPKLEGQVLLRSLLEKGLTCTYTHINAISYIMHETTKVFLGAASIFSNGTVYSRVGTACVSMVAHAYRVPVLICCEAYKFSERVQVDSICSNELGDPDAIAKIPVGKNGNDQANQVYKDIQLMNVMYDVTPSEYVSAIITEYGVVPPTSVPVILREYRKKFLWI